MSQPLTLSTFQALLGETFTVSTLDEKPIGDARLGEVKALAGHTGESFSLIFETTGAAPLPQGTYRFVHPKLETAMFVVPVGKNARGFAHEAIFNRG